MASVRAVATASLVACLGLGLGQAVPALAQAQAQTQTQTPSQIQSGLPHRSAQSPAALARPRIALVLSGGGARGFAHIGVLRVLRELRVPVDMVLGTSMGSVVGGAYAAGASVADLENMARYTDWDRVVADRPARQDLEFRRREEDVMLPSRIEFGVHNDGLSLPPAAAGNAALEQALGRVLPSGTRDRPVNQLALPFRSVASDLLTGDLVDLVDTPLFLTIRASLALPGMFAPVRVNGRLVVDGGLVRNLPVDLAHKMGADVVIAVNVGTPLAPEKQLGSALGVAQQMLNILTEQNVKRSVNELREHDILIAPDLATVSFLDFRDADDAMLAGEERARALAPRLSALALPIEEYAAFEDSRLAPPPQVDNGLPLVRVTAHTNGRINPRILEKQTGLVQGRNVTRVQIRAGAETLYGRDDLERVETEIIDDRSGNRQADIKVTEAPWATSRLRVGLELGTDFDDANNFALKMLHVRSSVNQWGAEVRTYAGVGSLREFKSQFFQPLGPGSQWYLAAAVQYSSASLDVLNESRRVARAAFSSFGTELILGRELGNWGDIQMGLIRSRNKARLQIPDDGGVAGGVGFDTAQFMRYRVDTLDSLGFPSRGTLVDAYVERLMDSSGNRTSTAHSSIVGVRAFRTENWAGHIYGEYAHAQRGAASVRLGGFLRLSGTSADSIEARTVAFTRVVMARRIGALPVTLGGTVRAGFSLELGGGFNPDVPAKTTPLKTAGSAFISVDTRFGPAYVGAGATKTGDRTLYIYLGPIW